MNYLKKSSFDDDFTRFCFYFCLVDILFLPYCFFVSVSYSIVFIFLWIFKNFNELLKNNDFKCYLLFCGIVMFSGVLGSVLNNEAVSRNIVTSVQMIQGLGYYFLFNAYFKTHTANLKRYLIGFVAFVFLTCVIYNITKSGYFSFIRFWNPRGLSSMGGLYDDLVGYRYSFIYMDPNNIAYMLPGIMFFIFTVEKTNVLEKFLIIAMSLFVLISTMSRGGMIAFFAVLAVEVVAYLISLFRKSLKSNGKIYISGKAMLCGIATVILACVLIINLPKFTSASSIYKESMDRLSLGLEEDSRTRIWHYIVNNTDFTNYVLFGYGGNTRVNGIAIKPHNGHLFMVLAYGMIAYVIFMCITFRKRKVTPLKKYLWIVPIFAGFTVNIMVAEVKLAATIMLMVAASASRTYLHKDEPGGNLPAHFEGRS